jgi:phage baseplate assembly protein W
MAAQLQRYFVGFSTQNSATTGVRTLYDIALIDADLMAAFMTRVGERVMRPDYGCHLWDYVMEPLTASVRQQIIIEATRICSLDTRCTIDSVQVSQYNQGFQIAIGLWYQPWNVYATFTATFEAAEQTYFQISS